MIRKATAKDFEFIYELYMHPQINPYLLYEPMDTLAFLPIFEELVSKQVLFVYEHEMKQMGMCKLVPQQHRNAHIIYLGGVGIHVSQSGKGHGLKMLQEIKTYASNNNFSRIELSVATINERAVHLYEKTGFVKEGIMKNFTYLKEEDKFLDEVLMACLL